jgi:hypothetical protein
LVHHGKSRTPSAAEYRAVMSATQWQPTPTTAGASRARASRIVASRTREKIAMSATMKTIVP